MSPNLKKVNLGYLPSQSYGGKSKHKLNIKKIVFGLLLIVILIGFGYLWLFASSSSSIFSFVMPGNPLKSTNDRVNILFLGNAGGTHDGALLTDSIIIASYHLKTHKVTLISVPRDLWIDTAKAKVNTLYEVGKQKGDGLKYAEDKIDDILGTRIHYGLRIDFSGFAKAIDLIDGVDVEVANTFDDYMYPLEGKENDLCDYKENEVDLNEDQIKQLNIATPLPSTSLFLPGPVTPGKRKVLVDSQGKIATDSALVNFDCRYEHIHFDKGLTHMDGETALKFVRSRHGLNGEGSDFARSKRQQFLISAFRSKVLSIQTLTSPIKILSLIDTFGKSFETDIPKERFLDFYKLVKEQEGVNNLVLGDLGDGKSVFINPPLSDYGGAWVLTPPNNDFTSVKVYLKKVLDI